ncbi:hypothetical protein GLOIN_2v1785279 [Rhizophagus irregularis DAOM 181602=DAOM 197198]|uniref:Uncharacterized protein n=2 Tax=Rhizophagus irregularis TaxID=588596 RepID=A0A2P4PAN1_RHIID|nr:hypothetical protein GLOIN_2v1785279 [Rhizophagus irregularis DAOM 181602=DAOM 197198]POG62438.1 hypothetical protein GLOIN_2v1785279 [Rhizophagus irregularis DAOM 181602=DAOM 197198]GBC36380.2 hypothetical protein GLOIN_2v1785279 [Rhizophagus irregularis DAOM 181602=DAOM 197198]|eukprot:XP_025169304.1 hypothetical protein GLOIN_2v1785279 [Rhizophagus irregularis DAOM 181602=DAOM 197198]
MQFDDVYDLIKDNGDNIIDLTHDNNLEVIETQIKDKTIDFNQNDEIYLLTECLRVNEIRHTIFPMEYPPTSLEDIAICYNIENWGSYEPAFKNISTKRFNLNMGITPSREDFVTLEGYAKKSKEERRAIIQNAGMEITDNDKEIAQFLGPEDEILGCFIRGIITICLRHFNNQRTKEFNEYIEDYKTAINDMIQQKTLEMNEWA